MSELLGGSMQSAMDYVMASVDRVVLDGAALGVGQQIELELFRPLQSYQDVQTIIAFLVDVLYDWAKDSDHTDLMQEFLVRTQEESL